jgi:hypothetical protein
MRLPLFMAATVTRMGHGAIRARTRDFHRSTRF